MDVKTLTDLPSSAPRPSQGPWTWLKKNLFASPAHILITVLAVWFLLLSLPALFEWAVLSANFTAQTGQECMQSSGACWSFIQHKYRMILFGIYPFDEQWRPMVVTIILIALIILSAIPK